MRQMRRVLANSSSAALNGYLSFSGALANGVLSIQLRKRIPDFLQCESPELADIRATATRRCGQLLGSTRRRIDAAAAGKTENTMSMAVMVAATASVRAAQPRQPRCTGPRCGDN